MQFFGQGRANLGIVFDSDMGASPDSALALALLFGLEGKNEARVVSLSVSRYNLKSAAFCEAVRVFYASATNPSVRGFFRNLPVGMSTQGKMVEDTPMLVAPLAKPAYEHSIDKLNDTADVAALIRNALTAQMDDNAVIVVAGPATNLVATLSLPGVKDLAAKKVRTLVWAAGAYPAGGPEPRIHADLAAAKKLVAEWPGSLIACGSEVGDALRYPAASIEKDFAWTPNHPVVDAYMAYKRMPYDAPASALAAVLQAVRPRENYFKLSEPGTIEVSDDGRTRFSESPQGKHRYLIADPAQRERVIEAYTTIASAKPVPRQPRFRPPEQAPPQPPKPSEVKPPAKTP